MAKGKFFNVDLNNDNEEEKKENVNQVRKSKYFQNGLDFSEDDKKLLLKILGGICAFGFAYYVVTWLLQK